MYFQRDYVLRMIEMIGELFRRILATVDDVDAIKELDEIANKACGLPLAMLRGGDAAMLADTLEEPQRFLAAELLRIATRIDSRTQTDDALLPLYAQTIAILSGLRDPDYAIPAADRVALILRERLTDLPTDSLLRAAALLEHAGLYADAEDALFAAMEHTPDIRAQITAFYDRLEALDDRALLAGNLTRDELSEGRAALN